MSRFERATMAILAPLAGASMMQQCQKGREVNDLKGQVDALKAQVQVAQGLTQEAIVEREAALAQAEATKAQLAQCEGTRADLQKALHGTSAESGSDTHVTTPTESAQDVEDTINNLKSAMQQWELAVAEAQARGVDTSENEMRLLMEFAPNRAAQVLQDSEGSPSLPISMHPMIITAPDTQEFDPLSSPPFEDPTGHNEF